MSSKTSSHTKKKKIGKDKWLSFPLPQLNGSKIKILFFLKKKEEENRRSSENAKVSIVYITGIFWDSLHTETEVAQSYLTICDPMDCSLPGSSIPGISQARVLEWVAISFSRWSSQSRDQTQVSRTAGRRFTVWTTREAPLFIWSYPYNLNMELGFFQFVYFFLTLGHCCFL